MAINRQFFFDQCRARLFTGTLRTKQVQGLTFILDVWEQGHAAKDDRWLAYALATAYHETAFTMQPIHEYGGNAYFFRMYDRNSPVAARRDKARELGNDQNGDGVLFHGRGYVQLTGRRNYREMGTAFAVDLTTGAAQADRALQPALAAKIMFKGMEEGTFTTRKFRQYFSGTTQDWRNARRIINGLDCADAIALYAQKFYGAISYTT